MTINFVYRRLSGVVIVRMPVGQYIIEQHRIHLRILQVGAVYRNDVSSIFISRGKDIEQRLTDRLS